MQEITERQHEIIDNSVKLIAKLGIQGLTIKNLSKETIVGIVVAAGIVVFLPFYTWLAIPKTGEVSAGVHRFDEVEDFGGCLFTFHG